MIIEICTPTGKPLISLPVSHATRAVITSRARAAGLSTEEYMQRIFSQAVRSFFISLQEKKHNCHPLRETLITICAATESPKTDTDK